MIKSLKRWVNLQRTVRCADHHLPLPFGLPRLHGGLLHSRTGCA